MNLFGTKIKQLREQNKLIQKQTEIESNENLIK